MKLTNKENLPDPIVWAVDYYDHDYAGGIQDSDISVTQLINPPQQVALLKEYGGELEDDASDRLYALLGHAIHHILETGDRWQNMNKSPDDHREDVLTEIRFFAPVLGWEVSGKIDRYDPNTGVLSDWKVCSVWESIYGLKPERVQQLNMLAWLMRQNDINPERLEIHSLYRDWSKGKARYDDDYPLKQFDTHHIDLWPDDRVEEMIERRVKQHQDAQQGIHIPCTEMDQWAKPTKYAVMKEGRKRAVKLHNTADSAETHRLNLGRGHYIEHRLGEKTRCEQYCLARDYCPQYKQEKEQGND